VTTSDKPTRTRMNVNDLPKRDPAARKLGPIPAAAAEAEPERERLYKGMPEADVPDGLGQMNEPPAAPAPTNGAAPAVAKPARKIAISTTVEHRGRTFTIVAEGYTLDQLSDLLDKKGYAAPAQTQEWQRLPDGTPICPKHHAPMRQREKQGDSWWSHNVGTKDQPIYCKGYHGKDSPGYDQ